MFWILLCCFTLTGLAESVFPVRNQGSFWPRWLVNGGLLLINQMIAAALPASLTALAVWCIQQEIGLLNLRGWLGGPLAFVTGFLLLDCADFLMHRLMHTRWLWKIHQIHHSDEVLDWSSAFRHHPLEPLLGLVFLAPVVLVFGIPAEVIVFRSMLVLCWSMFCHSNVLVPMWLDRRLQWLLIMPAAHWAHHSVRMDDSNSNFGNLLPVWDRLAGCQVSAPREGQKLMRTGIGLSGPALGLTALLGLPFRSGPMNEQETPSKACNR